MISTFPKTLWHFKGQILYGAILRLLRPFPFTKEEQILLIWSHSDEVKEGV